MSYGGRIRTLQGPSVAPGDGGWEREHGIDIRFSFRERKSGELALVVYSPDLKKTSESERRKFHGFEVDEAEFEGIVDPQFEAWVGPQLEGRWSSKTSPTKRLEEKVKAINSITRILVKKRLFNFSEDDLRRLVYPFVNTSHAYEDAHRELYRYFIDGINKACIKDLNEARSCDIKVDELRPHKALAKSFPITKCRLVPTLNKISTERAKSVHNQRGSAKHFPAYCKFFSDLEELANGLEDLLMALEADFSLGRKRALALVSFPIHECKPAPWFSEALIGKKVTGVEIRVLGGSDNLLRDVLVLSLNDGSTVGISVNGDVHSFLAKSPRYSRDLLLVFELLTAESLKSVEIRPELSESLMLTGTFSQIENRQIVDCSVCEVKEESELLPLRQLLKLEVEDGSTYVLEPTWNLGDRIEGGLVKVDDDKSMHLELIPYWIPAW